MSTYPYMQLHQMHQMHIKHNNLMKLVGFLLYEHLCQSAQAFFFCFFFFSFSVATIKQPHKQ